MPGDETAADKSLSDYAFGRLPGKADCFRQHRQSFSIPVIGDTLDDADRRARHDRERDEYLFIAVGVDKAFGLVCALNRPLAGGEVRAIKLKSRRVALPQPADDWCAAL